MSDPNGEFTRLWGSTMSPCSNQSVGASVDIDLLGSCTESEHNRNCNSSMGCVEMTDEEDVIIEMPASPWQDANPSNWEIGSSPARSVISENFLLESESDSELELIFDEAPPTRSTRCFDENYESSTQAANGSANDPADGTEVPTTGQANNSRLNLRHVPASIDLTRSRPPTTWRDYHARVRAQITPLTPNTGIHRLCAGQPPARVPVFMDEELGALVFVRSDTDSEEEPTLPPLAMVPRRGNSVSDLSQCSSDEEPAAK